MLEPASCRFVKPIRRGGSEYFLGRSRIRNMKLGSGPKGLPDSYSWFNKKQINWICKAGSV
jgi:hypothetical protein